MTPDTIARLRTDSLAATLTAARRRRVRRRAAVLVPAAIAFLIVLLTIVTRQPPAPALVATSRPASAPVIPPDIHLIRTPPVAVPRVAAHPPGTLVRFSTEPSSRVERIDNAGLVRCFPGHGVAVIRPEGELAKVVIF